MRKKDATRKAAAPVSDTPTSDTSNAAKRKKRKGTRNRLIIYLLYLVIATGAVSSVTLAKYATIQSGTITARAAAFVEGGSTSFDVLLADYLYPGDKATVPFTVKNHEDGSTGCEVVLDYDIEITTKGNLPLEFTLVGGKNLAEGTENDVLVGELASSGTNTWSASGGKLPVVNSESDMSTHEYQLVISWPATETDADYSYEIDMLQVTVNAVQANPSSAE